MPVYFFDLNNGAGGIPDDTGTELRDVDAAIGHAHDVARDLMKHRAPKRRHWSMAVCDDTHTVLLELPFVAVDETICHLAPELRQMIELLSEKKRRLAETVHEARMTMRQSRALVARSRGQPYLAAEHGRPIA
jgi:hypothetical protein